MNRRIVLATVLLGVCGPASSLAEQHQVPAAAWPADRPSPTAEEIGLHLAASEQRLEERIARVSRDDGKCELFSTDLELFEDIVTLSSSPNYPVTRVVYIDASAPLDGDGSSWSSAYQSIQDALGAEPYDSDLVEFRVAGGLYRADTFNGFNTLDPEQSIELPGMTWVDKLDGFVGVKSLTGGYAGRSAKNPDERNVDLYPTVFTGDLLGDDDAENFANYEDNTKVLFLPNETELNDITIEHARIAAHELRWITGCTVRYCFASGDDLPMERGDRSPVLARNARIVGNTFHNNRAEAYGGALTPRGFTVVANCRFLQNTAPAGGAIGVPYPAYPGSLKTQNCYFAANSATGESGGIGGAIYYGPTSGGQVAHCTFVGNWAQDGGGFGTYFSNTKISVLNSIFDQNFAYTGTGFDSEIYFWEAQQDFHTVRASVFRHYNANADGAEAIGSFVPFRLNTSANPAFRNLLGDDGILGTIDDDPSLSTESPAIGRSVVPGTFSLSSRDIALFDIADLDGDCDRTEPLPVDMFGNPRAFESTPGEGLDGYAADAGSVEYIPGAEPTTGQDWAFVDPLITDFSTEPIRLHVRSEAAPGGDGLGWVTAFSDLCDALLIAEHRVGPVEIWVAAGTYRASCERSGLRAFRVHENVTLLGGFAGDETTADERDWVANPAILSGDLLGNDDPDDPASVTDNAHHVVLSVGPRGGGIVDGFTIRDGLPQGYEFGPGFFWNTQTGLGGRLSAGLVYQASGEVKVRNCTFGRVPNLPNSFLASSIALAGQNANMQILDSRVVVEDSPIQPSNFVKHDTIGSVFSAPSGFGQLLIRGCEIALRGTSITSFWRAGSIEIDRSKVVRTSNPGGQTSNEFIRSLSYQPVTISNSVVSGSAISRANDIRIHHSTFVGGSTFLLNNNPPSQFDFAVTVSNSVFARGFGIVDRGERSIFSSIFSTTVGPVQYEPFGDHNTTFDFESNASAFFVDPLGPDGEPYTGDEDLRLAPGSPAINTGLNEFVTSDFDLDGNDRIIGSVVDRGAYEFTGTCTGDVNGDGVIDLGDLNKVLANYGQGVPFGDADGSGSVDMTDLNIVLAAFGSSCE